MMVDEEILRLGRALSHDLIRFLIKKTRNYPCESLVEKDGIIFVALIRAIITKIIHRCPTEEEATEVFNELQKALLESWATYEFDAEKRKSVN